MNIKILLKYGRKVLNYLFIIAIVFATLYVLQLDISFEGYQTHGLLLGLSFFLLTLLFILRAVLWHRLLERFDVKVSFKVALVSQFKTDLVKYIPGKVWMILLLCHALFAGTLDRDWIANWPNRYPRFQFSCPASLSSVWVVALFWSDHPDTYTGTSDPAGYI
jgi:hypothetical protein